MFLFFKMGLHGPLFSLYFIVNLEDKKIKTTTLEYDVNMLISQQKD